MRHPAGCAASCHSSCSGAVVVGATVVVGRVWMDGTTPRAAVLPSGGEPSLALLPEVPVVADSLAAMDETGRVINNAKVGALPDGIVDAGGFLWVANTADGEVSQIDPVTLETIDSIQVGRGPTGITEGFGSVWVANSDDRSVSRINASTGDVVSTLTVGTAPYGIAADDRWVWVTNRLDGTISRIDPGKDRRGRRGHVPGRSGAAGRDGCRGRDLGRRLRSGRRRARGSGHGGRGRAASTSGTGRHP